MHSLTTVEITFGFAILMTVNIIIIVFIALNFKIASDSKVEDAKRSVERRAERKAKEIIKERFGGSQIQVTQRIVVIEDDLKKEAEQ